MKCGAGTVAAPASPAAVRRPVGAVLASGGVRRIDLPALAVRAAAAPVAASEADRAADKTADQAEADSETDADVRAVVAVAESGGDGWEAGW